MHTLPIVAPKCGCCAFAQYCVVSSHPSTISRCWTRCSSHAKHKKYNTGCQFNFFTERHSIAGWVWITMQLSINTNWQKMQRFSTHRLTRYQRFRLCTFPSASGNNRWVRVAPYRMNRASIPANTLHVEKHFGESVAHKHNHDDKYFKSSKPFHVRFVEPCSWRTILCKEKQNQKTECLSTFRIFQNNFVESSMWLRGAVVFRWPRGVLPIHQAYCCHCCQLHTRKTTNSMKLTTLNAMNTWAACLSTIPSLRISVHKTSTLPCCQLIWVDGLCVKQYTMLYYASRLWK